MFSYYQQLENIICTIFIPTVTGQPPPSDTNRDMFVLPTRLGGLGLPNPSRQSDLEFSASQTISEPLKESILQQRFEYSFECLDDQISAKSLIKQKRQEQATRADKVLKISLWLANLKILVLASERGPSNWLTCLPIEKFGFSLHKGAFVDALSLHYGWPPPDTPTHCVCDTIFSVQHALSCPSLWCVPIHTRVFKPHAPSNKTSINSCFRKYDNEKKNLEQRICEVEHSSFSPFVFSATGGMAKPSTTFKRG